MTKSIFLPLWSFAVLNLARLAWAVHSPSPPSSLLSKAIVGGSTVIRSPPDEASTLFGVSTKNVDSQDELIYVEKRNGSKEPLERIKVSVS